MKPEEILFRGKNKKTGEWEKGNLVILKNDGIKNYFIIMDFYDMTEINEFTSNETPVLALKDLFVEVIPETVGQYIGINDKNNKFIFDKDIVLLSLTNKVILYVKIEKTKRGLQTRWYHYDDNTPAMEYSLENSIIIGNLIDGITVDLNKLRE